MKALLGLLSGSGIWWVAGAAALAASGAIAVQTVRLASAKTELAVEQRDRKDERLRLIERGLKATQDAIAEGARRVAALQGIIDVTEPKLAAARAAADRVPDLDRRVRDATAALYACRRGPADHPTAAEGSPATDSAAGVLAELQRASQAAEAARTRYADEAAVAGEVCASGWGALTVSPGPAVTGAE